MNIFCITDYFLPGSLGGGLITTLANMRKVMFGQATFYVFTRDRDLGSESEYAGLPKNQWVKDQYGQVFYATPKNFGLRGLKIALLLGNFDIIYINSFEKTEERGLFLF